MSGFTLTGADGQRQSVLAICRTVPELPDMPHQSRFLVYVQLTPFDVKQDHICVFE